jgi:hypothetical protein
MNTQGDPWKFDAIRRTLEVELQSTGAVYPELTYNSDTPPRLVTHYLVTQLFTLELYMYAVELVRHVAATTVSLLWSNICIACCEVEFEHDFWYAFIKPCECF